jgi:nicotinamide-nucleotide amidase
VGFSKKDMVNLQKLLRLKNKKLTTAESCTGGLIASKITQISGSSDIFNGGLVAYSNDIKLKYLGVSQQFLDNFGAVSEKVVMQMLDGALQMFNSDFAVAVSGIAGPNGGSEQKPVGTVVIGIGSKNGFKKTKVYHFKGNREQIQIQSANKALKKLKKLVKSS